MNITLRRISIIDICHWWFSYWVAWWRTTGLPGYFLAARQRQTRWPLAREIIDDLEAALMMDAPKGPIGDPVWHKAFWYRGSGIPGDVGTATIAGHVDDQLGRPEIFAHLQQLHPGDLIIVHFKNPSIFAL